MKYSIKNNSGTVFQVGQLLEELHDCPLHFCYLQAYGQDTLKNK